ncbi:MAG: NAD(P)-dependent oxidoreductase [Acidobacteriota bacterium]|nr:NAD(P)-dependent oxidoreductase [Acidobacteriota bacterium]
MKLVETEAQLETLLATPGERDQAVMRRLSGDVMILGAGGKMGPSLARRAKRAAEAAGAARRVIAVSRFSAARARQELEQAGVETIPCDLLAREEIEKLPWCENVLFLAGRKFGSTDRSDLTWAVNTLVPAHVAQHFHAARIVVFSTGNVYPFVAASSGGSVETDAPSPYGEYAQSGLGRERIFEYFSREQGTQCLIFRLNYAVDLRYGVLVDIARKVYDGQPIDLTVANLNAIWQGDANSYALRSLELCASPPRVLNVTGPEIISVRRVAEFFAARFQRQAIFEGEDSGVALLSNASKCCALLGYPEVSLDELLECCAHWIERGGVSLNKPTKYEVTDGRF